jgi:1-deoxyxylulose-5-phosphate synthase
MQYAKLGRTGLSVSRICLGCMSYGDKKWRDWVLTVEEAREHFAEALEAGINFFDTANVYSVGVSEEVTGRWLNEMANRDEIVVATKVYGPMSSGQNRGGLSRKAILQSCDASLKRLRMDYIDLYQIHRFDFTVPLEETLEALDSLVRAGKVRYLGASSMAAWQFAKALFLQKEHGWHRFVSMQNHYNLVYREEEREMNPLCIEQGARSRAAFWRAIEAPRIKVAKRCAPSQMNSPRTCTSARATSRYLEQLRKSPSSAG